MSITGVNPFKKDVTIVIVKSVQPQISTFDSCEHVQGIGMKFDQRGLPAKGRDIVRLLQKFLKQRRRGN
jgi:hypothetical protein